MQNNGRNIDKLFEEASKKLGTDKSELLKATNTGSVEKLLAGLSADDLKKIKAIMGNKSETEKLLQTPQAQALLKKLTEGKQGG